MGYDIRIGNAQVEKHIESDGDMWAKWAIDGAEASDAPKFPNDTWTENTNHRAPGYGIWAQFTKDAGIHDLFFNEETGLMRSHPGCVKLEQSHLAAVETARRVWEERASQAGKVLPPGFTGWETRNDDTGEWDIPDEGKYDHTLARLIWLEWWMRWALENCETPAIENW
jgi:hypothetical protein